MSSQEVVRRPPEQELVARVRDPIFKEQVAMALPPSVTVDHFIRLTTTALLANPELAEKAEHQSILRALVQSAAAGLIPDGKQAAIVVRGGKAVFQTMIYGLVLTAAEYGWTLKTKAIYANDEFEYTEEPEAIRHNIRIDRDRGDLIGAYATATHKDGRKLIRVMTKEQIEKRRAIATTQAVWNKWTDEMYEKTPGRDLFADLPLAESDIDRARINRLLDASLTDPAEASRLIYGGEVHTETPALPLASAGDDETPVGTDGGQQAAAEVVAADAAAAAPGPDDEAEPSLDDEPAQTSFATPTGVEDDPIVAAARAASQFEIPAGQHKGLALSELQAKGDKGTSWIRWALKQGDKLQPNEYRIAVWAFARVYMPDVYQEVLAWHEAQVAS